MRRNTTVILLAAGLAAAAPPLPGSGVQPLHEGPSTGVAIEGPNLSRPVRTDEPMSVCMIRVQFLEDFTSTTSGNGLFDLDADPSHDLAYFEGLMDQMTGYFGDISSGELDLTIDIYPTSTDGAYDMPHQMPYYGDDEKGMTGQCELLRDAVEAADNDIDFNLYDAIIVIHAGSGQEADIYSNSPDDIGSVFVRLIDMINYMPGAGLDYRGIPTNDNVYVMESVIAPEQESQDGFGFGVIGTICHEFCHQLGLPDLYNTDDGTVGVGSWDVMGYGQWVMTGWWPAMPGAWSRIFLGWAPVKLVEGAGTFTVAVNDTIIRIPLTSTEYLLIENRQRDPDGDGKCGVHEHDFGLPGSGILIWHIDETRLGSHVSSNTVNVDPLHKGVDLEEADGIQDFDWGIPDIYGIEGSEFDPYFTGGIGWLFGPETEPSSSTSWGGNTFVTVEVLDPSLNTMEITIQRSGIVPGWPIQSGPLEYGPLIWNSPGGERIVLTTTTGYVRTRNSSGSDIIPMGTGVTARPAAGDPGIGQEFLLLCEDDGTVHLRATDWTEPQGWPVTLPEAATRCLISSELEMIAAATQSGSVYMMDFQGSIMNGWPEQMSAPVRGICVYPDGNSPGLAASVADGSVYLFDMGGNIRPGWPVHPGSEKIGIPVSADIDRDGETEVICLSGDGVYSYGPDGELESGFPAILESTPLSSPCLACPDGSGSLAIITETEEGIAAVGASGATLTDWPILAPTDSLNFQFKPNTCGIGGNGFVASGLRDGRICLFEENGCQPGIFPVSVGDSPVGSPVLVKFSGTDTWRLIAADQGGCVNSWYTSFEPEGWFTGLDRGGENCWWPDDLPSAEATGGIIDSGSFFVYPNPVRTGMGKIRFQPVHDCSWEIRVFNIAGDLVTVLRGSAPGGAPWETNWDTSDFSPGVYFINLEVNSSGGTESALFHAAVVQ